MLVKTWQKGKIKNGMEYLAFDSKIVKEPIIMKIMMKNDEKTYNLLF